MARPGIIEIGAATARRMPDAPKRVGVEIQPQVKISTPERLEVPERAEPPEEYHVPQMAAPFGLHVQGSSGSSRVSPWEVERVGELDLKDAFDFVEKDLTGPSGQFPDLDPRIFRSWVRQAMNDRACWLCRTSKVFAYFLLTVSLWEPRGVVRQVFMAPRGADSRHRLALYRKAVEWTSLLRAARIEITPQSEEDLPSLERYGFLPASPQLLVLSRSSGKPNNMVIEGLE